MNKQQANDNRADYLPAEVAILGQAEDILRKHLERLGSMDHPEPASSFLRIRQAGLNSTWFSSTPTTRSLRRNGCFVALSTAPKCTHAKSSVPLCITTL